MLYTGEKKAVPLDRQWKEASNGVLIAPFMGQIEDMRERAQRDNRDYVKMAFVAERENHDLYDACEAFQEVYGLKVQQAEWLPPDPNLPPWRTPGLACVPLTGPNSLETLEERFMIIM